MIPFRSSRPIRVRALSALALSGLVLLTLAACSAPPEESNAATSSTGGTSVVATGGTTASTGGGGTTSTGGTPGGTGGDIIVDPVEEWTLVWEDEFEGSGLPDGSKWSFETQPPGWVNNELQAYTGARTENVRRENGSLIIEARRDYYNGNEYSSARIHTAGKAEFTYGRYEARAKLPPGRGTWPAIWLMPSDIFKYATTCSAQTGWVAGCNAWPNSGEIDIMEHVGHDLGNVHATIHCEAYNWQKPQQRTASIFVNDVVNTWHVYSLERTDERIDGFVDGQKYFSYENNNAGPSTWPFDEPFYFILNIAVGGTWGGAEGVDANAFPQRLEIDYVRFYERAAQ
jgi:beta-glucanase (GH16 family)